MGLHDLGPEKGIHSFIANLSPGAKGIIAHYYITMGYRYRLVNGIIRYVVRNGTVWQTSGANNPASYSNPHTKNADQFDPSMIEIIS